MTVRALTGLLAGLVLVPVLVGCGSETAAPPAADGPSGSSSPAGITGEYVADALPPPFDSGDVLRLTFGDGRIDFSVGCNGFGGDATWEGGTLQVGGLSATEMGCEGDGNAEEEWLADFLSSSPSVSVDGTDVRLADDGSEIWLVPADEVAPEPGPDFDLVGTRWRLVGIEETDGDSASMTVVDPHRALLTIDDGAISFDTTCNTGGGSVKVVGERLRVRNVFATLIGCLDARGEIEQRVMRVLGRTWVDWSITGEELRLTAGRTSLVYRAT